MVFAYFFFVRFLKSYFKKFYSLGDGIEFPLKNLPIHNHSYSNRFVYHNSENTIENGINNHFEEAPELTLDSRSDSCKIIEFVEKRLN